MAYEDLTPAAFKASKPQFSEVEDSVVQNYIDLGKIFVDQSWPETAYTPAWTAITCHLMTLDGLGSDASSKYAASGYSDFQSVKSGEITLTRFQKAAGSSSYTEWMGSTTCGRFFLTLARMTRGGPRIARAYTSGCVSPYAKDVPLCWPFYGVHG